MSIGEEDENVKYLQQQRHTTDEFLSTKLTRDFGLGELKSISLTMFCDILMTVILLAVATRVNILLKRQDFCKLWK